MKSLLCVFAFLGLSFAISAQTVSSDSLAMLKNSKEILKIKTEINKYQLKLADETNALNKLKEDAPKLQESAQKAADQSKDQTGSVTVGDAEGTKRAAKAAKEANKANDKVVKNSKAQEKSQKKVFDYNYKIQDLNTKLKSLEPVATN